MRLHNNAVPSIFPSFPERLQKAPEKKRRVLVRPELTTEAHEAGPSSAPDPPSLPPVRGRPKLTDKQKLVNRDRTIRRLKAKLSRTQKRYKIQNKLLKILQQENRIQHTKLDSVTGCLKELMENESKNKAQLHNRRYSDKIIRFALTMFYYSPKAYKYLRNCFTLPSPSTIRRWMSSVDCEPGFFTDVLDTIKPKEDAQPGTIYFNLVVDSMSIRKHLQADKHTGKIIGNVTLGDDQTKCASESLVFLLVPLVGGRARYPIGYFLIDKIDGAAQANLISQCLSLTAEYGIKVLNITFDGCNANITTAKKLGANLPQNNLFNHPTLDYPVSVTLDPIHMLKLVRNAFATLRKIDGPDGVIDFGYIEKLVKLQEETGLHLANKVRRAHLNWRNMKMKVKLAAQLLSRSTADSLEYAKRNQAGFEDAGATIRFIREVS